MILSILILNFYAKTDELAGFDEAWKGSARERLPGWSEELNAPGSIGE